MCCLGKANKGSGLRQKAEVITRFILWQYPSIDSQKAEILVQEIQKMLYSLISKVRAN